MRLTVKQAKDLGIATAKPRRSKYGAVKTKIDGITFDSKREAQYYAEILLRKRVGEIVEIELQPEFVLQDGYSYRGKRVQALKYKADFLITYKDGRQEVIDVKGHRTKEYLIKKKLLLYRYPEIDFREVK